MVADEIVAVAAVAAATDQDTKKNAQARTERFFPFFNFILFRIFQRNIPWNNVFFP